MCVCKPGGGMVKLKWGVNLRRGKLCVFVNLEG